MQPISTERPSKINRTLTAADKVLEALGWILLVALWGTVLMVYSSLPEKIPTHFNASGVIDSYGSKSTILVLPIVGSAVFFLLTIVNFFPQTFNYIVAITPENAERQQQNATRLLRTLKCVLLIVFLTIVFYTSKAAEDNSAASLQWIFPILIGMVFFCIGYFIYKSIKMR